MCALPIKLSGRVLINDSAGNVLVLRRAASSRRDAGKWEFPGGRTEPGEELEDAIRRELAEETGLHVELGRVVGAAEWDHTEFRVVYLVLEGVRVAGTVRLGEEHDAHAWVPRSDLTACDLSPPFRDIAAAYAAAAPATRLSPAPP